MDKPKECVHSSCKEVFYVPIHKIHMLLMCDKCKKNKEMGFLKINLDIK